MKKLIPVMHGRMATYEWEADMDKLVKVGISVLGKQGPFKFELEKIIAEPDPDDERNIPFTGWNNDSNSATTETNRNVKKPDENKD